MEGQGGKEYGNLSQMDKKMKELLIQKIIAEKRDIARRFMVAVAKALDPELEEGGRAEEIVDQVLAEDDAGGERQELGVMESPPLQVHVVRRHALWDLYDCPVCGSKITLKSKTRHQKTTKHRQAEDVWQTRFEMKT